MPQLYPWLERVFTFDGPVEMYPDYIERLRGTPARIEDRVRELDAATLTRRDGDTWSIQENIGHLLDLEPLLSQRLDQLLSNRDTLQPWAGHNKASWDAGHNSRDIADLLAEFRSVRSGLLDKLDSLSLSDFARASLHPRLQKPMRLVDLCEFHAVHDDYHLARISQLLRLFA